MTTPTPNHRWYHLTPDRFLIGLLAVQILLLLSDRFQWLPLNEKKGWMVLIAVGVVGLAVLVMLFWGLFCLLLQRRFQFGVRSLLLFVVALSVSLSWFASELQKARRQREAVEGIREAVGSVVYDYETDGESVNWLDRPEEAEPVTPAWLRKLFGNEFFSEVVHVDCGFTGFDDNDAKHLRELTNLTALALPHTQITDKGLAHLENMTELEWLDLSGTQVTDHGFAHLKQMTKLERLILEDTQITDQGLVHLESMNRLDHLWLSGTQITDGGVEKVLPNCEIYR